MEFLDWAQLPLQGDGAIRIIEIGRTASCYRYPVADYWGTNSLIRSEVSALAKSLCSEKHLPGMAMLPMTEVTLTPSGMVMLLILRVTVAPLSNVPGHSAREMTM